MMRFIAPAICLGLVACEYINDGIRGSGVAATEFREVGEFDRIELSGAGTLEITVGPESSLEVTADDNLLPILSTEVTNRLLSIRPTESISPLTALVFRASVADLREVRCSGAGNISFAGVDNQELVINLTGAASICGSGITDRLSLSVSGAGNVDLSELLARDCEVDLSGAASASVHADDRLDVRVSGAGSVTYTGDPEVAQKISGVGSVTRE